MQKSLGVAWLAAALLATASVEAHTVWLEPVEDGYQVAFGGHGGGVVEVYMGTRLPVNGNPDYTELSYEYLLGFHAK